MTGTPEGSTESGFMEKLGILPATTGLQNTGLSPTPKLLFVAFLGINQFCWVGLSLMTGTPSGSPKKIFFVRINSR